MHGMAPSFVRSHSLRSLMAKALAACREVHSSKSVRLLLIGQTPFCSGKRLPFPRIDFLFSAKPGRVRGVRAGSRLPIALANRFNAHLHFCANRANRRTHAVFSVFCHTLGSRSVRATP